MPDCLSHSWCQRAREGPVVSRPILTIQLGFRHAASGGPGSSPLCVLSGWPLLAAPALFPDPPNAIIDRRFHERSPPRSFAWPLDAPRCLARIRKVAVNSCLPERNLLQILPIFHQSSEGIVLFAIWKRFLPFSCLNLPPLASNGNATFL